MSLMFLRPGQYITPRVMILPGTCWTYASECSFIGGGIMPGARLRVVEIHTVPGQMWVKVALPALDPVGYLKISGEEFSWKFEPH